ncbi:hypothetical protein E4U56_006642 [Claviceps arundinis]|uniref:DUF6570 domain-containing protein n=1 Tax=Claviceps arundinis TaxID=1623583 RepID=A0A9P7SLQ8_9HYPO|nr:hypothetical protein E4U56_006642 [Claviceps arundinis]
MVHVDRQGERPRSPQAVRTPSRHSAGPLAQATHTDETDYKECFSHPPDVPQLGLTLDPVQVSGELDVPCLTDTDQRLLRNFERALAKNKLTERPRCLLRCFTIEFNQRTGICQGCTKDDAFRVRNSQLPALWSEAKELDPVEPPEHLSALTSLEEWLIARVHTRMQVMTYRGAQYKYCGHIISFPKNLPTMNH